MRIRVLLAAGLLALASVMASPAVAGAQEEGGQEEGQEHDLSHEAEECLEILQEGGEPDECQEAPSPILPATNEIVWGSISFLVLFVALAKFALPPIRKAMDARADRIRESLDEAESARTEAQSVLDEYKRQMGDARNEAGRIIEEARQAADAMRRDLVERAEAEAADLRERARADIQAATERALADLRTQVADLAIGAAEKVVVSSLSRDTQIRLIEEYINQVGSSR